MICVSVSFFKPSAWISLSVAVCALRRWGAQKENVCERKEEAEPHKVVLDINLRNTDLFIRGVVKHQFPIAGLLGIWITFEGPLRARIRTLVHFVGPSFRCFRAGERGAAVRVTNL